MPLGMEVGLKQGDFVLDRDPAPPPKKGWSPTISGPCLLWPNGWMDQDDNRHRDAWPRPGHIVLDGTQLLLKKVEQSPQFSAHVRYVQTAGWIKMPHDMQLDR